MLECDIIYERVHVFMCDADDRLQDPGESPKRFGCHRRV